MRRSWCIAGVLAVVFGAQAPAQAGPVTALEAMRDYNLIVFDDFDLRHDIQGSIYVGGNLTGNNMVGSNNTRYTGTAGLTVAGDVKASGIKVKNGDFYAGGNVSGLVEIQDGGSAYVGGTVASNSVRLTGNTSGRAMEAGSDAARGKLLDVSDFLALSADLASREADIRYTAADVRDRNNFRLQLADTNGDGLTVLHLDDGFLGALSSYGFYGDDIAGLGTIVVNVAGKNNSLGANWQQGGLPDNLFASQNIIWNFYEAEVLTFDRQIFGSVLAPGARVSNVTPIDGTLVAGSFTQNGQVHLPGFTGDISFPSTLRPAVPAEEIPEPLSVALLGMGLVGVACLRRRS